MHRRNPSPVVTSFFTISTASFQRSRQLGRQHSLIWFWLAAVAVAVVIASCSPSATSGSAYGDLSLSMYTGADRVGGEELSLSTLEGQPVVLNFWAGLCPPCRAEMPDLQRFHEDLGDEALLVGVDVGQFTMLGGEPEARELLDSLNITYPTGSTPDRRIMQTFMVTTMPTTVFVNPDGTVFRKWSGVLNHETLVEITNEMLAQ